MKKFTFEELSDVHLIYGEAKGNGRLSARLYRACYPQKMNMPLLSTFASINRRLRETESFVIKRYDTGRNRNVRTVELYKNVLNYLGNSSFTTGQLGAHLATSHVNIWKITSEQLLHPYKFTQVQALSPADFLFEYNFQNGFVGKIRTMLIFHDLSYLLMKHNLHKKVF